MQLVQDPVTGVNSNQSEDVELMLQRGPETVLTTGKENVVRPGVASTAARAQVGSSMGYGKRPFSAAAALSSYRASAFNTLNQPAEALSVAVGRAASGIKRPHSAAASSRNQPLHAREKSSGSLASCLSVVSHTSKTPRSMSASSSRSGQSRGKPSFSGTYIHHLAYLRRCSCVWCAGDRLLASTREHIDNTFVYAVPRHFLEHGLPYDPYDIVPVTHVRMHDLCELTERQGASADSFICVNFCVRKRCLEGAVSTSYRMHTGTTIQLVELATPFM
ncbi:unnamed protein product [Phytophthora lilii]|uniref:Unnamed protein product n=1 Tax=Phytophthora lilii TaxID=2077276 RepID=A0A9W6U1Q8_9STRA|nr:unnamed protein product [Phytophthora lilii]